MLTNRDQLAIYAFSICMLVLFTNGWCVPVSPCIRTKRCSSTLQGGVRSQPVADRYALVYCDLFDIGTDYASFEAEIPWQQIDVNLNANGRVTTPVLQFLASYIPIVSPATPGSPSFTHAAVFQAIFVLLTFGYKLIHQTRMVSVEEMPFDRGNVPPQEEETEHEGWWNKIIGWALVR